MNCKEFENIVNDLARAKIINAEERAAGLAHAEICERCSARLSDERALSAGLKSLAASDERKAAPNNIEAALLTAFRARTPNPIRRRSRVQSGNWPRWALAAAAILIAFGFILYRSAQNESRKDDVAQTPTPQPAVERENRIAQDEAEPEPRRESRAPRNRRSNRSQPNSFFIRDSITAYSNDIEYLTDFYPLNYGDDQTPMESGQLIRVQMPRSVLARFGLPVNVERANTPIKAELLVGEDGLAQAIRFVR